MTEFIVFQRPLTLPALIAIGYIDAVDEQRAVEAASRVMNFAAGTPVRAVAAEIEKPFVLEFGHETTTTITPTGPPPGAPPPTAAFTFTPPSPSRGTNVNFDASPSTGAIADYAWAFGDGSTGSGAQATHQYTAKGDFAVTLVVTASDGQSGQQAQTVTVK